MSVRVGFFWFNDWGCYFKPNIDGQHPSQEKSGEVVGSAMRYHGDKTRRSRLAAWSEGIKVLVIGMVAFLCGALVSSNWHAATSTQHAAAETLELQLLQAADSLETQLTAGSLRKHALKSSLASLRNGVHALSQLAASPGGECGSSSADAFRGLALRCADWDALPPGEPLIGRAAYENISLIDLPVRVHYEPIEGHSVAPAELQPYAISAYWFWVKRGQWELGTLFVFRNILDRDTVVVDFGAWVGPTVLYAAAFAGEVWGIEADATAYSEMVRNVAANAGVSNPATSDNIHLRNMCIDSQPSVRSFSVLNKAGDSMSSLLWQAGTHAKGQLADEASPGYASQQWYVPCLDLPTFIYTHTALKGLPEPPALDPPPPPSEGGVQAQHAYQRLAALQKGALLDKCSGMRPAVSQLFVKMDTEGGELLIMPQAAQWLRNAGATVLLSVHVGHVENHKANGYPMSSRRAVAAAIRLFPLVYRMEASGRGAINPAPMDTTTLTGETLCTDCEYLLRTEPLPQRTLAAIDAFNAAG